MPAWAIAGTPDGAFGGGGRPRVSASFIRPIGMRRSAVLRSAGSATLRAPSDSAAGTALTS